MIVIYPMNTVFKRTDFVIKLILIMYVVSFLSSLLATILFKSIYKSLPISLCLLFVDPTNSIIMIKVITWFVIITQSATSIVIMIIHIILGKNFKESSKSIRKFNRSGGSGISLILQLSIITTSNVICWFPVNGIYITTRILSTYPIDLGNSDRFTSKLYH